MGSASDGGLAINIRGRDILGPVTDACMDPRIKWSTGMTIAEVVLAVLHPHGISKIVNSDDLNLSVVTGKPERYYVVDNEAYTTALLANVTAKTTKDKKLALEKLAKTPKQVVKSIALEKARINTVVPTVGGLFTAASGVYEHVSGRKDLRVEKLDALKPKIGEGGKDFLDRVMKRFGLSIRALADGSGVMATVPRFEQEPLYDIYHTTTEGSNVLRSSVVDKVYNQPALVVGYGVRPSGEDVQRSVAIAINELSAYDRNGNYTAYVQSVLDRYKHAKVAPIRDVLVEAGKLSKFGASRPVACFLELQEARTMDQLVSAVKRELARLQNQALECRYTMLGFSQNGIPWTVNTIVRVHDEVSGVYGPMWIKERAFKKASSGGTTTELTLIRPYTMEY
jgi:hypothetical protein